MTIYLDLFNLCIVNRRFFPDMVYCDDPLSCVVYIIQVKLPVRLRLKLIVMMSLMTSQGRMCVRCVTNGLQQSNI